MQTLLRFGIEYVGILFEIRNQVGAVPVAFFRIADGVQFKTHILQAEIVPQPLAHHDQFRIDVRAGKSDGFRTDLMELAITTALRPFVPEHRARIPEALGTVIGQIMFKRRAHHTGRAFGTQGQLVAVHRIGERIHFLLDDIGHGAKAAREQGRRFDDRCADLLETIALQHGMHGVFKQFPQRRIGRENIVHSLHADDFFCFLGI